MLSSLEDAAKLVVPSLGILFFTKCDRFFFPFFLDQQCSISFSTFDYFLSLISKGVPLVNLETELVKYLEAPSEAPFNISTVSTVTRAHAVPQTNKSSASSNKAATNSLMADVVAEVSDVTSDERIKRLNLGPLLNSSSAIELTEKEVFFS